MFVIKLIIIVLLLIFRPTNWFIASILITMNSIIVFGGKQLCSIIFNLFEMSDNYILQTISFFLYASYYFCNILKIYVYIYYNIIRKYKLVKLFENSVYFMYDYINNLDKQFKSYIVNKFFIYIKNFSESTIKHLKSNPALVQECLNKSGKSSINANMVLSFIPNNLNFQENINKEINNNQIQYNNITINNIFQSDTYDLINKLIKYLDILKTSNNDNNISDIISIMRNEIVKFLVKNKNNIERTTTKNKKINKKNNLILIQNIKNNLNECETSD